MAQNYLHDYMAYLQCRLEYIELTRQKGKEMSDREMRKEMELKERAFLHKEGLYLRDMREIFQHIQEEASDKHKPDSFYLMTMTSLLWDINQLKRTAAGMELEEEELKEREVLSRKEDEAWKEVMKSRKLEGKKISQIRERTNILESKRDELALQRKKGESQSPEERRLRDETERLERVEYLKERIHNLSREKAMIKFERKEGNDTSHEEELEMKQRKNELMDVELELWYKIQERVWKERSALSRIAMIMEQMAFRIILMSSIKFLEGDVTEIEDQQEKLKQKHEKEATTSQWKDEWEMKEINYTMQQLHTEWQELDIEVRHLVDGNERKELMLMRELYASKQYIIYSERDHEENELLRKKGEVTQEKERDLEYDVIWGIYLQKRMVLMVSKDILHWDDELNSVLEIYRCKDEKSHYEFSNETIKGEQDTTSVDEATRSVQHILREYKRMLEQKLKGNQMSQEEAPKLQQEIEELNLITKKNHLKKEIEKLEGKREWLKQKQEKGEEISQEEKGLEEIMETKKNELTSTNIDILNCWQEKWQSEREGQAMTKVKEKRSENVTYIVEALKLEKHLEILRSIPEEAKLKQEKRETESQEEESRLQQHLRKLNVRIHLNCLEEEIADLEMRKELISKLDKTEDKSLGGEENLKQKMKKELEDLTRRMNKFTIRFLEKELQLEIAKGDMTEDDVKTLSETFAKLKLTMEWFKSRMGKDVSTEEIQRGSLKKTEAELKTVAQQMSSIQVGSVENVPTQ